MASDKDIRAWSFLVDPEVTFEDLQDIIEGATGSAFEERFTASHVDGVWVLFGIHIDVDQLPN